MMRARVAALVALVALGVLAVSWLTHLQARDRQRLARIARLEGVAAVLAQEARRDSLARATLAADTARLGREVRQASRAAAAARRALDSARAAPPPAPADTFVGPTGDSVVTLAALRVVEADREARLALADLAVTRTVAAERAALARGDSLQRLAVVATREASRWRARGDTLARALEAAARPSCRVLWWPCPSRTTTAVVAVVATWGATRARRR